MRTPELDGIGEPERVPGESGDGGGEMSWRVLLWVVGLVVLSAGLWGWQRWRTGGGGAVTHEVVWVVEDGTTVLHGRINPDLVVMVAKSPHGLHLTEDLPFRRNWLGVPVKNSVLKGGTQAGWGEPGESFAMMDEQDWFYVGFKGGTIERMKGVESKEGWARLTGAERERVVRMYEAKTGKVWPDEEEGGQVRF